MKVNKQLLENWRSTQDVHTKLLQQNAEYKLYHERRWYAGLLRWKRQRHITAMEGVL